MKRTTMMAVLLLIMAGTAVGQVRPFVKAGIGTSEYWLQNAEGTDMRFSYAVGAGVEIPFRNSRLGISPSLLFVSKGANADESEGVRTKMQMTYLEVPLDLYYRLPLGDKWSLRFAAGPYLSYGVGGTTKVSGRGYPDLSVNTFDDDGMNRFDCGLNLGFQATFKKFFFGIDYDLGFVPIHEKSEGLTWPSNLSTLFTVGLYF